MAENYWLEHCLKPRARPSGVDWDVFISYRSADRVWALALYDMLRQFGYDIFLDQYVLQAGEGVLSQLSSNLRRSASGVIVWSERSEDSVWVEREVSAMVELKDARARSSNPFYFVAAKLDAQPLPTLLGGSLYIDFSAYPDGPTGSEIVRLTSGLQGASLNPPAVQRMAIFDEEVREEPAKLRALVAAGQFDEIRARALSDTPAYTSAATLIALAAQLLISGARVDDAMAVLDRGRARFPRSVRLRQLQGLALRRAGRNQEALVVLEELRAKGHNDPETLGILAAAVAASWKQSQNRDQLERARDLYDQAFQRSPSDTYSGINAASKSALFGDMDRAAELANRVLATLTSQREARGGEPSSDYWERATEPEALFLQGRFAESLKLYHAARIAHQEEKGSIRSTWAQLELLLSLPFVPEEWRAKFRSEFAAFAEN